MGGFRVDWEKSGVMMMWTTRSARKKYRGVESFPLPTTMENMLVSLTAPRPFASLPHENLGQQLQEQRVRIQKLCGLFEDHDQGDGRHG